MSVYPDNWDKIAVATKKSTKWRCSCCYRKRNLEAHHTLYRIGNVVKPSFWAIGLYLFPLCVPCHNSYHVPAKWVQYRNKWNNRNKFLAIQCLRVRYWVLRIALQLWRW